MPRSEPVDLLATSDPLLAFARAHGDGQRVALPTSGTADRPRMIVRSTSSWVDSFSPVSALLGVTESSLVWIPGPLQATMNLFAAVHASMVGIARVDDPREATHAHLTPATLQRELALRPDNLAGVHVLTAGDRLERSVHDTARALGVRVSHYYGAAELSFVGWGKHADALRLFPGVEAKCRHGELWVRSPYLCEGYLEADRTLRIDRDGWVSVGDRGDVADGYVAVLGRAGGINTGGATVMIADIEHVLRPLTTGLFVVLGLPHPNLGQVVTAVVTRAADIPTLRDRSRHLLTPAQRPRRWLHLDPMPLTGSGKVDRGAVVTAVTTTRARPL